MIQVDFSTQVVQWFARHGRQGLPWQQQRTAYRVWLSEIMLQQTQVKTVIPYYLKFTERFPTVENLATAPIDEVMSLWAGLGYYARARNLHQCAVRVMQEHAGKFPQTLDGLQALPGIGRSTAGAILAQAFDKRGIILDGNVKRVLSRYAAIEGWSGQARVQQQLWQLAETLTPREHLIDYTQAIMDLGATICIRNKPHCEQCPVAESCVARQTNRISDFPARKPKRILPQRYMKMFICQANGKVLLEKRPPVGIWGGLWSLPETNKIELDNDEIAGFLGHHYGVRISTMSKENSFQHTFTHFRLEIEPWHVHVESADHAIRETDIGWFDQNDLGRIGLPKPVDRLMSQLTDFNISAVD